MGSIPTKKVIIEFPEDLLKRTEEAASELSTDRSKLIRSAVEHFLNGQLKSDLERQLAEGYVANAKMDRQVAEEFAYVDAENI